MAPIAVGNKIPDATLMYLDDDNRGQKFNLHEKLKGRKAMLIGVPGAFTPTWSQKHIPSLIELSEEIKRKGVSDIIVISVNDQYVMKAWERSFDGGEQLKFLADGSAEFYKALDLDLDLSEKGMGQRSRQYSLMVTDLVVEAVNLEEGGLFADFEESQGQTIHFNARGQFRGFEEGRRRGVVSVEDLDEGNQCLDGESGTEEYYVHSGTGIWGAANLEKDHREDRRDRRLGVVSLEDLNKGERCLDGESGTEEYYAYGGTGNWNLEKDHRQDHKDQRRGVVSLEDLNKGERCLDGESATEEPYLYRRIRIRGTANHEEDHREDRREDCRDRRPVSSKSDFLD